jgi:TMEM175 potassium channel family protein
MNDEVPPDAVTERIRRRGDPERVKAFTDGVFSIIITILVLEISVPADLGEQGLRRALEEIGPTLWAWVISFLIVGMYWVWHRDLFAQIRTVNRDVVWLNLVFLLPTSLIPFAAALLGEYSEEAIALRAYGVVLTLASFARVAMYWYVIRRPSLLFDTPTVRGRRLGLGLAAAPVIVYALAMAVAGVAPMLSILLYLGLPLMYFVLITLLRQHPETSEDADEYS